MAIYSLNINVLASAVERLFSTSVNNVVESITWSEDAEDCVMDSDRDDDGDGADDGADDDGDDVWFGEDWAGFERFSERQRLSVGAKHAIFTIL